MNAKENSSPQKILLISHNFSPEPTGIGKINGEMINWLATNGYNCTIITTFPYYPYWKVQAPYKNRWYKKEVTNDDLRDTPVTVYRCPSYVPVNPTAKKRILQDISFWGTMCWTVFKLMITREKFDLIITVAPPFHLAALGLMLKKTNGGKLLYHIQDLQIETAQKLKMVLNKKIFNLIYKIEKNILMQADYVSGISEGMINKIKSKVKKDVFFFPNWVDTSFFFPIKSRDKLKIYRGYEHDDVIFLYSGAIGEKQGLEDVLLAAESLLDNKKFKFIICGSGCKKERLIQIAASKNLTNVKFLPVQDKELFNEFLNMADYHLIVQNANAGDLVMPSKLATILAVGGVCIATASPGTSLYNLISGFRLGHLVEPDNHEALSTFIREIQPDYSYDSKKENARNYANQYLNIDGIMNGFLNRLFPDELPESELILTLNRLLENSYSL